jgi:hypothetical protein
VRIVLLVVTVGVVVMIIARWIGLSGETPRSTPQAKQDSDSVARYATDEFVAACRVRPRGLIEHAYFGSLSIDSFLPAPLSLGRLDAMGVEDLVVFCGPLTDRKPDDGHIAMIEWAAVARTSHPIELEEVMRQWRRSLVPREEGSGAKPATVQIENYECFRVPAGSFFPPPRTYGELQFTERDGQLSDRGINVGREYQYRSYVEGATKSSAIFTLDHLREADLVDGHLPLELRADVFHTYFLDHEYSIAQIELRNPDSGLCSEPITFESKSYVNHRLNVPRKLTAVDVEGKRQVDLLKDLVSRGRLEIILKMTEPAIYLGVKKHDLNVRPEAFEYVFVADHEIVVAQSPKTLKKMLSAAVSPASLANRLSQPTADIVMIANVRDESQRIVFQQLTRANSSNPATKLLADALTDLTATVSADEPAVARVTAELKDRRSASRVAQQFNQVIRSAKAQAHSAIGDALGRQDALGSLISLVFDGVSMNFPDQDSPTANARESQLLSIIDGSLNNIHIESDGNVLTVEFEEPKRLSRLSEAAQFAVANMEEVLARDLFKRERFDLSDEMYERVTNRFPQMPQAWFRRAHQLSYNTSIEFDGYENRYAWVRRGVNVLLDGAEQNVETTDLTWMAARFIGRKVGEADERAAYRQLFSRDERLHKRIAEIIDVEEARSPDKEVDNWLVAKLLFEHCIDRHAETQASLTIPALLFFSRPAATQARYAQALSESGHWDESLLAWKEAEQLHNELGEGTILAGSSNRIRLNDLESRLAEFGPNDASVKQLQAARKTIQLDYWLMRCELEQTAAVQLARKLSQQAAEHARRSEPRKAYDLYQLSLQAISEVHQQRPTQMSLFAGEFQPLAARYRRVAKAVGETHEEPWASLLTLIEQSQPVSSFPLMDLQNAGELK